MRSWDGHGDGSGDDRALEDATVEELLAGRYEGDAPDLVSVAQLLERVRSCARGPVPPPSAALAEVLGRPVPVHTDKGVAPARRRRRAHVPQMAAAACAAVLVAAVVAAGSARVLPGPTQTLLAKAVRAVTPFELPQDRASQGVMGRAGVSQAAPPGGPSTPPPTDPAPPVRPEPRTSGTQAGDAGGGGVRRPSGGDPPPRPTTTVTSRGAPPPEPETKAPAPTPPAPAKGRGFTAELSSGAGDSARHATAVLDVNPGRNEVCLTLVLSGVAQATSAHLHAGVAGVTGPVVATFAADPGTGTPGGCVTLPDELVKEIRKEPGRFYVDVHTTEAPNGALRGQLTK